MNEIIQVRCICGAIYTMNLEDDYLICRNCLSRLFTTNKVEFTGTIAKPTIRTYFAIIPAQPEKKRGNKS